MSARCNMPPHPPETAVVAAPVGLGLVPATGTGESRGTPASAHPLATPDLLEQPLGSPGLSRCRLLGARPWLRPRDPRASQPRGIPVVTREPPR